MGGRQRIDAAAREPHLISQYRRRALDLTARFGRSDAMRKIAANTGWLLGERLARALIGFVVAAWVARYLGPERFGQFAYVIALVALFQTIAALGADGIVVRDLAREPKSAAAILGSILRLRLITSIICWLSVVGVAAVIDPHDTTTIVLVAVVGGTMIFQVADTVDLWFQSQTQSRRTVMARLWALGLVSALKIVLVIMKAPLIAFAATLTLEFAATSVALVLAYRKLPTAERWSFDRERAVSLLRQSWPFMLSGISVIVYVRIDQIMLKQLRGEHDLGIYAAALPLSQIWQMIPVTLALSLGPHIARKKLEGEAAYERALVHLFRLVGAMSLGISISTAAVSGWIVPLLYGERYADASLVLSIHVFTNLFVGLGVIQTLWLANERAGMISLLKTLSGGAVAIIGNALLIPRYGVIGAACVAVASQAMSAVFSNLVLAPRLFLMQLGIQPRALPIPKDT